MSAIGGCARCRWEGCRGFPQMWKTHFSCLWNKYLHLYNGKWTSPIVHFFGFPSSVPSPWHNFKWRRMKTQTNNCGLTNKATGETNGNGAAREIAVHGENSANATVEVALATLPQFEGANGPMMSSREIAELVGKEHRNVMRDIRNMMETLTMSSNLSPCCKSSTYVGKDGRNYDQYELDKDTCLTLLLGYDPVARMRVVKRWQELEQQVALAQFNVPKTYREALRLAIEQDEKIEAQQKLLEEQRPKVLFADAVSSSEKTILVGELAKMLKQNGMDIGQNRLFERLREEGYLISRNGIDRNMPTQKAMDLGLFEIRETAVIRSNGTTTFSKTPRVTGRGQVYFVDRFLGREAC